MPNELWHYLQSRTVTDLGRDVLDVLITYYIFYRVALVLKGTRAMQILVGLALVFVLYVVAQVLRLNTVLTIMTAVLSSAILIGVVVFQSDIRRGLMRMGARAHLSSGQTLEGKLIDDVVEAAQILARHRTGAIITFEQEANLDEFVGSHQGHVIDAAVTPELLVSLFIPEAMNKLHDGAVIIRDLRIAKAGVFFPMPEGRVADESFGSRHRAAMGITEETDAVVVVVSEERGTISFCFNGNIIANLDGPRLRAALEGVFAPKRKRKKESSRLSRLRAMSRPSGHVPSSRHPTSKRPVPAEGRTARNTMTSVEPGRPLRDLPRHGETGGVPRLPKNAQPLRKRPAKDGALRDSDAGSPTATPNPLRERTSLLPSLPEGYSNADDSSGVTAGDSGPLSARGTEIPSANRNEDASEAEPAPSPVAETVQPVAEPAPPSKPALIPARPSAAGNAPLEPLPLRHLTKPSVTQANLTGANRSTEEPERATLPTTLQRATPIPEGQDPETARGDQ